MLGAGWTEGVALAAAFVIAVLATPAGISGAVLLLPFQVSVLGTPSPAVTPTNLLYNVVATPGALYRYWRQGQNGGRLAVVLIAGTLPGVIAGSVIRVEAAARCPRLRSRGRGGAAPARRLDLPDRACPARNGTPARARRSRARVDPARGGRGLRRRDLRHRRRVDPGPDPHRHRAPAPRSRPGRPGVHLRDLGGRGDHVPGPLGPSPRVGRPRLADRNRAGRRRAGGRVHRCPDPAASP